MPEHSPHGGERAALASVIDHTILKADASRAEIERFCDEARRYGFKSVCVNSVHAPLISRLLDGSNVKSCVVVGFPLGAMLSGAKAAETRAAVAAGAGEIDMVLDIGALKEDRLVDVEADIAAVRAACPGVVLKVIIETCLLDQDQKIAACRAAVRAGADFVKTSTGFSTGGATIDDVALMRRTVGPGIGVKASGGIRTAAQAHAMLDAGATRLGASSGVAILEGATPTSDY